jgi:hypothetical protein
MTVRIPVEADASAAVRAINEIRTALAAAGVDARGFANIDLSKMGTKEMVADLERMRQNLQDLVKIGRGDTATGARRAFGANPSLNDLFNINEHAAKLYPDAAARERFVRSVSGYALRGTSVDPANAPPAPPGDLPPPSPPPPPPERPFGAGAGSALWGGVKAGAGFFMAQAGLSSIEGAAGDALHAGQDNNAATDALLLRVGDLSTSFEQLNRSAEYFRQGLLVTQTDLERYATVFAVAAGHGSGGDALRNARIASGMASSYGVDGAGFAHAMGQARFLSINPAGFAAMVGETVARGNMGGRVEEVMSALLNWTQNASRYSSSGAALAANVAGFDSIYTSMQRSGNPMFAGANGAAVLDSVNGAIMGGGGGGVAGQVLVMRAMMGAGMHDPYSIDMQLKRGAFAPIGGGGTTNYDAIMGELRREYGGLGGTDIGGARIAEAGGTLLGINPNVAAALLKLKVSGTGLGKLGATLAPYGGINGVNPTAIADIIKAQDASPATLAGMAYQARHMKGLSQANADAFDRLDGKDPERTRQLVIKALAETGMPATDQTRALDATAELTNAMTKLGKTLQEVIIPLKNTIGHLIDAASPLFSWAAKQLGPSDTAVNDSAVVLTEPSYTAGGATFRARAPVSGGAQRGTRQNITLQNSLLARIGQQESGLGSADPDPGWAAGTYRVYGEIPETFVADVKGAALSDPTVAAAIAGKSDAEIAAMETLANWPLQQKSAAWGLAHTAGSTDMEKYANWNFGKAGGRLMAAPPGDLLDKYVGGLFKGGHDPLFPASETVGQWKAQMSGLFPGDTYSPGGASGAPVRARVDGSLTVIIKDAAGRVHDTQHVAVTGPRPSGAH